MHSVSVTRIYWDCKTADSGILDHLPSHQPLSLMSREKQIDILNQVSKVAVPIAATKEAESKLMSFPHIQFLVQSGIGKFHEVATPP